MAACTESSVIKRVLPDRADSTTENNAGESKRMKKCLSQSGVVTIASSSCRNGGCDNGSDETPLFVDQYHVVKRIFQHLKLTDLLAASQVNSQWAEIGRVVRRQRKNRANTFLYHPYIPHHKLAFQYFNGFEVSDAAKQLVESGANGYHSYASSFSSYKHRFPDLVDTAKLNLHQAFSEVYDEPQVLISFATTALCKHLTDEHKMKKGGRPSEKMSLLTRGIDNAVPCITSFNCGIVSTEPGTIRTREMEKSVFPCLSSLAVPKAPGLNVKVFTVTKDQNKSLKGKVTVEECKKVLGINESNEPHLKGIILMHKVTHRTSPLVEAIFKYLRSNPSVALGGGVHEGVLISGEADSTVQAGGLLIFGDENVRVSSVALQDTKISPVNQQKVDKLKSCVIPDGGSFGFLFVCNGRGRHMHGRPDVESKLLNATLPHCPIAGSFTLGEFCHEVMNPISPPGEQASPPNPPKKVDFAYTTVFVLVSYKLASSLTSSSSEAQE